MEIKQLFHSCNFYIHNAVFHFMLGNDMVSLIQLTRRRFGKGNMRISNKMLRVDSFTMK